MAYIRGLMVYHSHISLNEPHQSRELHGGHSLALNWFPLPDLSLQLLSWPWHNYLAVNKIPYSCIVLTHCDLVTPNSNIDLGWYWLGTGLVPKAIIWANVALSAKVFCGIHLSMLSKKCHELCNICLEIALLKLLPHLPGLNELTN